MAKRKCVRFGKSKGKRVCRKYSGTSKTRKSTKSGAKTRCLKWAKKSGGKKRRCLRRAK